MPARTLLRSWLPVRHRCCRRRPLSSSSTRRLSSSEILTSEPPASRLVNHAAGHTARGAFPRGIDERSIRIGSSTSLGGPSTNAGPRSDSSGTGIVRDTNGSQDGGLRHLSRGGTVDRDSGTGGRALDSTSSTSARRSDQGRRPTSAFGHAQRGAASTGTGLGFQPSSTVILKGIGTTLIEADIRRLVPRKKHLPDFRDDHDIVRVIPFRDVRSLDRRPIYHLTFATSAAALEFTRTASAAFSSLKSAEWPDVGFPPASSPEFSNPDRRSTSIVQRGLVLQNLSTGGGAPGQCVLLTICGLGGRTRETEKLPRTEEVRGLLEEKEVELCERDLETGGAGVQRIVLEKPGNTGRRVVKADGRGLGAQGRWLIRCKSESEAHRAVRELHMRAPWEGGGIFRAEVIY